MSKATDHLGEPEYTCPACGSEELAAQALERKHCHIDAYGQLTDEEIGDIDFESFRCTRCGRRWQARDEVIAAIHSIGAAGTAVTNRLTRDEQEAYYRVLDALQAVARADGNEEQIG